MLLLVTGCHDAPVKTVQVLGVERVMMHQTGDFTFLVKQKDSQLATLKLSTYHPVVFFDDVPAGQSMWLEYQCRCDKELPQTYTSWHVQNLDKLTIHLRKGSDVDGGDWDHGKFGRGRTEIVR